MLDVTMQHIDQMKVYVFYTKHVVLSNCLLIPAHIAQLPYCHRIWKVLELKLMMPSWWSLINLPRHSTVKYHVSILTFYLPYECYFVKWDQCKVEMGHPFVDARGLQIERIQMINTFWYVSKYFFTLNFRLLLHTKLLCW